MYDDHRMLLDWAIRMASQQNREQGPATTAEATDLPGRNPKPCSIACICPITCGRRPQHGGILLSSSSIRHKGREIIWDQLFFWYWYE
jgi:hypothetical protein